MAKVVLLIERLGAYTAPHPSLCKAQAFYVIVKGLPSLTLLNNLLTHKLLTKKQVFLLASLKKKL
jgi:hypothetical protein